MLGPLASFFSSLFSLDFYHWVSHVRRGVGLSYSFAIALITVIIGTIYLNYYYGADWLTIIVVENKVLPLDVRMFFSVIVPNEFLVFLVLPAASCALLTLLFFNLAIICSVSIGQALNYLYEEPLEFDQVLRINCYTTIVGLGICGLSLLFLPALVSILHWIFLGTILLYNFYAIVYPKFDL